MDSARFPLLPPPDADSPLFLQRAGCSVLVGYREPDRWVLARGWRRADRFTDIRLWRFQTPEQFIAQVGRLVDDELPRAATAEAVQQAGEWVDLVEAVADSRG